MQFVGLSLNMFNLKFSRAKKPAFLLKERFIDTSHGDISRHKGNSADTHNNF